MRASVARFLTIRTNKKIMKSIKGIKKNKN